MSCLLKINTELLRLNTMKTWTWMLPFCVQQPVSMMFETSLEYVMKVLLLDHFTSQSFSALCWYGLNQHSCATWSSNLRQKKKKVLLLYTDRTTK